MCAQKKSKELTLMDAVDNLSALAELDTAGEEERSEGIESKHVVKWLSKEEASKNQEEVKETFKVLHNYLKHVYEDERSRLKEPETQKGIQAIMVLAGEAAKKVDAYTDIFHGAKGKGSVTELPEFQNLQKFYLTNIIKRFQETLEEEEAWQEEWGQGEESVLDIQRRGLKDLETVRRDKEYELFHLRKEDGRPFYNRNLLRHIRLVGDFDEVVSGTSESDPFLKIAALQDREAMHTAQAMLERAAPYIDAFFKEAFRLKKKPLVARLSSALIALMLAGNGRNAIGTTTAKNCLSYFGDFHDFLRSALLSEEYQYFIAKTGAEVDPFVHSLINLSHLLCMHLFMRVVSREECLNFIYQLIGEKRAKKGEISSLFHTLLEEDEKFRDELKKYPNGPVLKTLDVLRLPEEERFFDPLAQQNLPFQLFAFEKNKKHVTCLHLPAPIHQKQIEKVGITEEFLGFLRALNHELKPKRHLLINLQDRTSWQERARCVGLEEIQRTSEFAMAIAVVTLPKSTDFYLQTGAYLQEGDAKGFKEQILDQVKSGPECGFFYPKGLNEKALIKFSKETIEAIHTLFFDGKKELTRKNRLDFIELFYLFFVHEIVSELQPDSMSFTCKDGIDTGAAQGASYFLFLRMLSDSKPWKLSEKEHLMWMLQAPALFIRERAIDIQRLHRMISALSVMEGALQAHRTKVVKTFDGQFKGLKLIEGEILGDH